MWGAGKFQVRNEVSRGGHSHQRRFGELNQKKLRGDVLRYDEQSMPRSLHSTISTSMEVLSIIPKVLLV